MFGLDYSLMCAIFGGLWIHKRHCDVSDTGGGRQAFVVVGEAARVHEGPAFPRGLDGAVVAEEPASTTLQTQHVIIGQLKHLKVLLFFHI